jgi:glycosyltransferase involved in cell wall biosynthesis/predicted SAM-dependent methyltransferase
MEDGVWVHRIPVAERCIPELHGHPLKATFDHLAAVRGAVQRIAKRAPLDVIAGSTWMSEPLLCALDADPPVSVTCISPMRKIAEDQPEVAAAPLTPHQIRLEEALLNTPGLTLTSVSEENASVCRELTDRPIGVTWLGVEDRRARHPRRRADDDAVEVLFVGRQEPRKGLDTLLEAAPGLLRDQPNVRVRICGADNPYANGRPDLFPEWVRIHAPDVADRIIFDGDLSDSALFDAYANADVFCAPSRYESFGLVHVEAMMMGLPVVAGDAGGMRETVVTGETGILVPPGEPEGLRAALDRLVGDTELRARMGVAGRERYEREFSVPVWVARQVDLFTRMVSRSSTEVPPPKALTALVSELCELDRADGEAAAAVLLDPLRYPYDPEQEIREALACPDDGDFVDRVYKSLLGRLPEPDGRAGCLSRLSIEPRASIVKDVALSDEAVARGVLPGLLGRLPETDPGTATRELVAAGFLAGDVAFVDQLARIVGFDAKTDWAQRLASGASRSDVAREALATPQARRRIALPDRVRVEDVHTDEEIVATLRRARDDREFVEALYVALLDRAPDESGLAGYERVLRSGVPRAIVAAEVAGSAEAAGRGVPGDLRYRLARGLSRPSRSLRPTRRRRSVRSPAFQPEARLTRVIERIADHSALEARLAELASTIRQERHAHEMERAELQSQLRATRQDAEVVARKYEALALDLRDRLPPRAATLLGGGDGDPSGVEIAWVGELRLNVGCGEKPLPGYVNVDFRPLPGVDVVADASNLPFPRGGVSELASFHLIEHFREHYVATVLLPHWRSLLRPEGVLRLVTPNWEVLVEQLRTGVRTWREFKTVTFGLQDYSGDDHFALYTPATLTELLESAGFEQITILAERRQNGLSPEIELLARPSP